jgi:flagellar hook-associated protein 1 FlgK
MANGILGIGTRALNIAQMGLVTTEHNISNVNTPGFHRQEVVQTTALPFGTGAGYLGQGAQVDTVKRIYSQFLDNQVLAASTQSKFYDSYYAQVSQIDNMLADPNAGLSPALQDFFSGVQAVANDPASIPARQSLLSDTQTLTARFSALSDRLQQIRSGVNTQLTSTVTEINAFSTQIADINQKIVIAQSANQQPPNDLLDQRDQLVAQLNEQVKATVVKQSDGTYNIFVGNGQPLVVGASAYGLGTAQSPEDPDTLNVVYQTAGGGQIPLNQSDLSGGNLGGLLAFRTDVLDKAQNELGRVALTLAETVNNQHQLGQDLNGALGGAFFNIASTSPTVQANTNNSGAGVLSATLDTTNAGAAALTTSNYRLTYNAGNYTVLDLTNNTSTTVAAAALSTAIPGVNLSMAGLPNNGDSFLVLPTRNGARDISLAINDVSQIAAAAPIRTAAGTANTGTASINAGSVDNTTQPPLNANLQQPVTITFTSATTFDVTGTGTGNPVGVAYTPGGNISYNGWVVQISGTPAAGDAFTIAPNTGGVADGRNALAIGTLQTTNLLAGNTTTYQGAYSQLVSEVGNKTRETQLSSQAQGALLSQTQQSQQSLSGVNLDEEAANLMRYQQAYQAVAKVIQTAGTLFDTILNLR